MNTLIKYSILILAISSLSACNTAPIRDPEYAATLPALIPPVQTQQANASGSIYQAGYDVVLFEDIKARRIGDILTIRLNEATNASKEADTEVDRTQDTTVTNPTVLGASPQFSLPPRLPLDNTRNLSLGSSLESDNAFAGSGKSTQSNRLTGDITVTVADVFPNGNLYVRGEKRLNLNRGNEYIKISGIVRPKDIGSDNTVDSPKLADATIIYSGDGEIADANKLGWLARFFISAVFPF
jgi:flagellar L-ring protein precursor FlgH